VAKVAADEIPGYRTADVARQQAEQVHHAAAARWGAIERVLSTLTPDEQAHQDMCHSALIVARRHVRQRRTAVRLRRLRATLVALREHEERCTVRIADAIRAAKALCPEWPAERAAYQAMQQARLAVQQVLAVRQIFPSGDFGALRQTGYAKRWTGTELVLATEADIAAWPALEWRDLCQMDGTLASRLLSGHPTFGLAFGAIFNLLGDMQADLVASATQAELPALAGAFAALDYAPETLQARAQGAIVRAVEERTRGD
jgi:hypothetical protein